jgi:tRNA (guanosine-2'-O-)-methyltransferase
MPRSEHRREKVRSVLAKRQPDLTVVMENIHDPHNVSAVLRSCDAVGIMQIELLYNLEKFPKIGKKSSSSASKWLERRKHTTVDECYSTLRSEGFIIYATHLSTDARSLYDVDLTQKVALVFGNEHRGVTDEAATKADGNFIIPMVGMIQSLNISVACAVSLYEAMRQRLAHRAYDAPKFSPDELRRLFDQWIEM